MSLLMSLLMNLRLLPVFFSALLLLGAQAGVAEETLELPLSAGAGGAFELAMNIDGVATTFLLDTGAAMATINSKLFRSISDRGTVRKVREVAARMADGRTRRLEVYEIDALHLVGGCDLGPTEVIVVPGSGRNLLGLNVLANFAPLTLSMSPPSLGLSNCTPATVARSTPQALAIAAAP